MKDLADKIRSVLDEAGVSFWQNSRSFIMNCPKCSKKDKLYIRKSDGRFVCWVCKESEGFSGACEWALTELTHRGVAEIRSAVYGNKTEEGGVFLSLSLTDFYNPEEDDEIIADEELPEVFPDPGFRTLDSEFGKPGRDYLESRGIPLQIALEYGIQYWPAKNRVVFPVSSHGKLLGWQARYVKPTDFYDEENDVSVTIPKALTSLGLKKEKTFMFGDRVNGDHAILCEGPIDAIKAHKCGGNIAALGKAVSERQLEILRNSGITKLYLALDPDAFKESKKVLKEMAQHMDVYDMRPPSKYSDLGEMSFDEVFELYKNAPQIDSSFLFLYLKDHYAE